MKKSQHRKRYFKTFIFLTTGSCIVYLWFFLLKSGITPAISEDTSALSGILIFFIFLVAFSIIIYALYSGASQMYRSISKRSSGISQFYLDSKTNKIYIETTRFITGGSEWEGYNVFLLYTIKLNGKDFRLEKEALKPGKIKGNENILKAKIVNDVRQNNEVYEINNKGVKLRAVLYKRWFGFDEGVKVYVQNNDKVYWAKKI